jgi:Family of unknown function (DUF6011)
MANAFLDEIDALLASPMGEVRQPVAAYQPKDFSERCASCRGSGRFVSYSGRIVGPCFKCKGAGKKTFKTSPESRATAVVRKVTKLADNIAAFKAANPEVFEWLQTNTSFEFAVSLNSALTQYGDLTEGQLTAAKKCVAKLAEAKAAKAERVVNAPAIDVSKIETAFATAKGNKIKRPKLNLGSFNFSCAPESGKNAGSIYVKNGETYLGKVTGGKFFGSYTCTPEQEAEVLAVASNPSAAAKAYGFRSGNCSCCGRVLTKGISIDMGIGPICATKYGW